MAFGLKRQDILQWKREVRSGNIAFLTHYWQDPRFPGCNTVTKVGCSDVKKLISWGNKYGLKEEWIDHYQDYPHFDLFGERQKLILRNEQQWGQIRRFNL
ncbi:hypothetical protein GCM10011409_05640 [Lentibacillus populi]|uniref:YneQ n=1 Tax=Lentibacillus populi TaxID=1827502 RepID=A0A9W5TVK4_9BACI|nr:hypothetical protein [Lentibacillus populi]GGB31141.1 hypothetical protein GCM10011409_05640 [Lentibacillus populi]